MANRTDSFPLKTGPINIIVACAENRVIGAEGRLPWSIPEDWGYFLEKTKGGIVLLGRICWEELYSVGPVPVDRRYVIISTSQTYRCEKIESADSFEKGLGLALAHGLPVWICGGQRIYEAALPLADYLYLTKVHATIAGDTYFPEWRHQFTNVLNERSCRDAHWHYTFYVLGRDS